IRASRSVRGVAPHAALRGVRMSGVVLHAEGLHKRFGATRALDGAGLCLRAGEIHALMGQNGAGKSTLIKLLTGVESPDAGTVTLDGRAIAPATPLDAQREGISTVYQEVNLCPNLSRSEEHTSELQSRENLVCRLLLEKKKKQMREPARTH